MSELQNDLKKLRTLVQKMGWAEFMGHVGSLLAEQADKTEGSQSGALAASSCTIHALRQVWQGCGTFTYPKDMVDL